MGPAFEAGTKASTLVQHMPRNREPQRRPHTRSMGQNPSRATTHVAGLRRRPTQRPMPPLQYRRRSRPWQHHHTRQHHIAAGQTHCDLCNRTPPGRSVSAGRGHPQPFHPRTREAPARRQLIRHLSAHDETRPTRGSRRLCVAVRSE